MRQSLAKHGSTRQAAVASQDQKSFGAVQVLEGFDLEVEPGEFLVLLGASGSGKTTALRILAGLETATAAASPASATGTSPTILPKYRDISMVFQSYALYPHKTVAENIGFPLKVRGVTEDGTDGGGSRCRGAGAARRSARALSRASFPAASGSASRWPAPSSGGPSVFLMDEPLSNLDAKLRGYMRAELKHMQHELGVTTIYVTHDQIEAMTLAHRVAIMERGVLQQLGTPREIYNDPANLFVAGFIGSPPMNFVAGEIAGGRFRGPDVDLPLVGGSDWRRRRSASGPRTRRWYPSARGSSTDACTQRR